MENGLRESQLKFLKKITLFENLSDAVLGRIAESMKTVAYEDGDNIIKQGDIGEEFFMVKSGDATVTQKVKGGGEKVLTKYGPGDYFGELALMKDEPRKGKAFLMIHLRH